MRLPTLSLRRKIALTAGVGAFLVVGAVATFAATDPAATLHAQEISLLQQQAALYTQQAQLSTNLAAVEQQLAALDGTTTADTVPSGVTATANGLPGVGSTTGSVTTTADATTGATGGPLPTGLPSYTYNAFQNYGVGTPQGNALANPDAVYMPASLTSGNYLSFTPNQAAAWWAAWFKNPVNLGTVMPGFMPGSLVLSQADYQKAVALQESGTLPNGTYDYNPLNQPIVSGFNASTQLANIGWINVNGVPTPPTTTAQQAASQAYSDYMSTNRYLPNGDPNPAANQAALDAYNKALQTAMGGTIITSGSTIAATSTSAAAAPAATPAAAASTAPAATTNAATVAALQATIAHDTARLATQTAAGNKITAASLTQTLTTEKAALAAAQAN